MIVDLHIHSTFSDSSNSVEEVIKEAIEKSIEVISIVDHDTIDTFEYIKTLNIDDKIKIIPGVEISAYDFKNNKKVHLLGYNYSNQGLNIANICSNTLDKRNNRSIHQITTIKNAGYNLDETKIKSSVNSKGTIYRQQIMYELTHEPYTSENYQTLYKKLFKNNGVASMEIDYIDVFDALEAIKKDGGIPVLAHPGELDNYDIVDELVRHGLQGIEVYHPKHTENDVEKCLEIASKYNLIITGGSDNHGIYGADFPIEKNEVPMSILFQ